MVCVLRDGRCVTGSDDGTVHVFTGSEKGSVLQCGYPVFHLSELPQGRLACAGASSDLTIWDVSPGNEAPVLLMAIQVEELQCILGTTQ